jgi:hypothetical protein
MPWQRREASDASLVPVSPPDDQAPDTTDPVSPTLAAWAEAVDVSRLSDQTVKQAERFLRDYRHLNYLARREYGLRLRAVVERQVSPPPPASIAVPDIAATVLSVRRKQLGTG